MKRFYVFVLLVLGLLTASAQNANEFYVRVYNTIQEADALASDSQNAAALQKYRQAQTALQSLQKSYPDWNASTVRFRLSYVAERIAEISAKVPSDQAPAAAAGRQTTPSDLLQGAAAAAMEGQLNVLRDQVRLLQDERAKLQAKLKEALAVQPAASDPRELAKAEQRILDLEKENELLKANLEQARSTKATGMSPVIAPAAGKDSESPERRLKEQTDRVLALEVEKKLLQERVAELEKEGPGKRQESERTNAKTLEYREKIERLTSERDDLLKKLDSATRLAASRSGNSKGRVQELENEVAALKEKIKVLEAQAIPYTREELALFNASQASLGESSALPGPSQETVAPARLPEPAASLAGEAQRDYAAGRLEQAEAKFQEALKKDQTDVVTLANLAVVQLDLKQLDAAEKSISRAIVIAPDDAFSLGVLGRLRWQQKRFDDALDALSRAAKLDPNSPEIQNYLGLVLAEKGMRAPAERALRKAVQLRPSYGAAHQNLAVVYLTQNPPLVDLARFHYNKSLACGTPPNPGLEKLIETQRTRH